MDALMVNHSPGPRNCAHRIRSGLDAASCRRAVDLQLNAVLGAVFGALAAACAFFISYAEYKRNWNFRGSPTRMALRSALVAFVFFFAAAIALGYAFRLVA
jgi:hypothetical protein